MAKYDLRDSNGSILKTGESVEGFLVFNDTTANSVIYKSECDRTVVAVIPPVIFIIEIK